MKPLHIAIAVAAFIAVYLLTPPETKVGLGESWLRLTHDPGQLCFDYERKRLNDPFTAKLQTQSVNATDPNEVRITLQAKNSYGAYMSTQAVCIMKAGTIDADATVAKRKGLVASAAYQREMQMMDEGIKCLENKIARRRAGEVVSALPCPGE